MKTGMRPEVDTVTIHIPMRFERRGGRKLIIAPDVSTPAPAKPDRDETGNMRHVHHKYGAYLITDLPELIEVDGPRIS